MIRTDSSGRLQRLDRLSAHLKEAGFSTIKELAEAFGVSQRTIARDIELMRDQGMPIDADRGRGGGVRLDRNWGVGRLNLNYAEAVDMLISVAVAEQMQSPIFLANLGSIRRQLVASFSPDKRARVERLKSRVLIGRTASLAVQGTIGPPAPRVVQTLHQSFLDQESLMIGYRNERGAASHREIEPHYLLLNYPVWYVLAIDSLRGGPRTFRIDRITSAERTGARFKLSPKDGFHAALTGEGLEKLREALH